MTFRVAGGEAGRGFLAAVAEVGMLKARVNGIHKRSRAERKLVVLNACGFVAQRSVSVCREERQKKIAAGSYGKCVWQSELCCSGSRGVAGSRLRKVRRDRWMMEKSASATKSPWHSYLAWLGGPLFACLEGGKKKDGRWAPAKLTAEVCS